VETGRTEYEVLAETEDPWRNKARKDKKKMELIKFVYQTKWNRWLLG
jgi:hypothetical protein